MNSIHLRWHKSHLRMEFEVNNYVPVLDAVCKFTIQRLLAGFLKLVTNEKRHEAKRRGFEVPGFQNKHIRHAWLYNWRCNIIILQKWCDSNFIFSDTIKSPLETNNIELQVQSKVMKFSLRYNYNFFKILPSRSKV